ncbi:unnamed protein product [Gongylonema pulchrum]|uniref:Secreted protein n=1 Tax=Gongylonema pulchrum TaxID=637853 RepID=A0A183DIG0_9BILA|nr:unnamed protein product [Gongylonema pulchrum]
MCPVLLDHLVELAAIIVHAELDMIGQRKEHIVIQCWFVDWRVELQHIRVYQALVYVETFMGRENQQPIIRFLSYFRHINVKS